MIADSRGTGATLQLVQRAWQAWQAYQEGHEGVLLLSANPSATLAETRLWPWAEREWEWVKSSRSF